MTRFKVWVTAHGKWRFQIEGKEPAKHQYGDRESAVKAGREAAKNEPTSAEEKYRQETAPWIEA